MLNIDRRDHTDTGIQYIHDILPTLFVLTAFDIGMSQFVNDDNFRMDTENRLQVHLFDLFSFIKYLAAGDDRQSFHQCLRLDSPMCFYITDLDIDTAFQ